LAYTAILLSIAVSKKMNRRKIKNGNKIGCDTSHSQSRDPDGVPIDGGISLLVGAAVVYGVKALRKKSNKEAEEKDK
jgi:hypothetical protein